MTVFIGIIFTLCTSLNFFTQERAKPTPGIADPVQFDEWHDLVFTDERARLDNIAIYWRRNRTNTIYLIIYAGQRACAGEARERGIRAKKHLMKRNVPSDHIVWIDGGWREEVTTQVWIWPSEMVATATAENGLSADQVKIEKGCKIKYRGGRILK